MNSDWQRHVLACSGYLELGMFDDAALVLEEIAPEDKNREEVLGARVVLYMAAKKWDMAAAVASHLVKVEPENETWWINLAYSVRRSEGVEKAEAILLRAQAIHPKVAMIAFKPCLLCERRFVPAPTMRAAIHHRSLSVFKATNQPSGWPPYRARHKKAERTRGLPI